MTDKNSVQWYEVDGKQKAVRVGGDGELSEHCVDGTPLTKIDPESGEPIPLEIGSPITPDHRADPICARLVGFTVPSPPEQPASAAAESVEESQPGDAAQAD